MSGRVLVIDDEKDMLLLLRRYLQEETDLQVQCEADPLAALEHLGGHEVDLVITDLRMPGLDGLELLRRAKQLNPELVVVVLTAHATVDNAVTAMRLGAFDYLTKPFTRERLITTVNKGMEWLSLVRENQDLKKALHDHQGQASFIVGSTPAVKALRKNLAQIAPSAANVLITGPSGTGKEMVARELHRQSRRADRKLITVNCTAIPETILESELFGHMKGAFTGAYKDKKGLVEEADGGTLFLDEIGDTSPMLQTKLLRLLQGGEYKPLGGNTTRTADVRFIAATNRNLKEDIETSRFRADLYYRLNVIHIRLPSLRERAADIPLLAHHFLRKYAQANQKDIKGLSPAALRVLMEYHFPGNIRELENIIERGVIFCQGDALQAHELRLDDSEMQVPWPDEPPAASLDFRQAKERAIQDFHRRYVADLLERHQGNVSQAAEAAGIQRQYLHRLMREAGVGADEFKP